MNTMYKTEKLQDQAEIARYCEVIRESGARSYLEIGSKFGGSLWAVARAMPPGSRIVSVDLPNGTKAWKDSSESLKSCIQQLQRLGYDAHVVWGDSKDQGVLQKCASMGPYDAIMIDADHRMPGVTADWNNYRGMGRGTVAFHDISWKRAPEWVGTRIDVPEFWRSIKDEFSRTEEIVHCPTGKNNGIGVGWL